MFKSKVKKIFTVSCVALLSISSMFLINQSANAARGSAAMGAGAAVSQVICPAGGVHSKTSYHTRTHYYEFCSKCGKSLAVWVKQ